MRKIRKAKKKTQENRKNPCKIKADILDSSSLSAAEVNSASGYIGRVSLFPAFLECNGKFKRGRKEREAFLELIVRKKEVANLTQKVNMRKVY